MRGADLVAQSLVAAGVDTVFALSGNQIMPIFDACLEVDIRLVHVRHEAAAVYMADAWAQLSGGLGVALVTAGPGFANCLSPLFTARAYESPVLLLTGDAPISQQGQGAFQEMDQVAVSSPLTKLSARPANTAELAGALANASRTARSGRPGPVHLALSFDVLQAQCGAAVSSALEEFARVALPLPMAATGQLVQLLEQAARPLVVTGPLLNATRAGNATCELANAIDAPVIALESPRGLRDPALGDFAKVLAETDFVLSLGKPVDFMLGLGRTPPFSPNCRFAVVDPETEVFDAARRNLGDRLVLTVQADADEAIKVLTRQADARSARETWRNTVTQALGARSLPPGEVPETTPMHPGAVAAAVQRVVDANAETVLIIDGGEFGQWVQAHTEAPKRLINGPSGAIGGCLCYALAAKLLRSDATVIVLMGDGTAGFHFSEFETAARCGTAFVAIVGNDARWNAEYQIQLRDYGKERLVGCELSDARYDLAAAGLGCYGEHVTQAEDLDAALERALASGMPSCINVVIDGLAAPSGSGH